MVNRTVNRNANRKTMRNVDRNDLGGESGPIPAAVLQHDLCRASVSVAGSCRVNPRYAGTISYILFPRREVAPFHSRAAKPVNKTYATDPSVDTTSSQDRMLFIKNTVQPQFDTPFVGTPAAATPAPAPPTRFARRPSSTCRTRLFTSASPSALRLMSVRSRGNSAQKCVEERT